MLYRVSQIYEDSGIQEQIFLVKVKKGMQVFLFIEIWFKSFEFSTDI